MGINKVVDMIANESGLSKEEVALKIKNKQKELSGLVSKEGAAYIVANELGVRTRNRAVENSIPIENVSEGIKSVTVDGRITQINGPNTFKTKKGREGKVVNLKIVDKSGSIRVAIWKMSDIEKIEEGEIKKGDIVRIKNGYVKPGYRGGLEINLGNRGILVTDPEGIEESEFPKKEKTKEKNKENERVKIKDLKEGDSYKEIRPAIVDFFGNQFSYDMCPNCNKRLKNGKCQKCGDVEPDKLPVLNLKVDDGTGSIRTSLFRDAAEKFLGMKAVEIDKNPGQVKEKLNGMLGTEYLFRGRIKRNNYSGDLEFNAYSTEKVDPEKEAKKLLNEENK